MGDGFAGLHDPDDGGLGLEVAVFGDALVGFLVLRRGFFRLDLVDFDAEFGVGEIEVEAERVAVVDLFAFGVLGENLIFCTCK